MKIVKKILLAFLGLIVLILLAALFVSKSYTVQRQVMVDKPSEQVFEYVKYLKNQDNYNKWVMADPKMNKHYTGQDGTEGFVYAWSGNKEAGKGEQEIKRITDGKKLDVEVRFIEPFEGVANTEIVTQPVTTGQTKVIWTMNGKSKYPLNIMNLFIDKMLGKDLQTSLNTLKQILENK